MTSTKSMSILKAWGAYAAAVIVRIKALAPYALIELVLPGGSVMALLLWLYRRRKHGVGFRSVNVGRNRCGTVWISFIRRRSHKSRLYSRNAVRAGG
jgi:hypothetical protein